MSRRNVFEIIVPSFGLYCLIATIQYIPLLGVVFFGGYELEFVTNVFLFRISHLLIPVVSFVVGFLFLTKTQFLVSFLDSRTPAPSEPSGPPPVYGRLSLWITLLGLYYLVSSAAKILSVLPGFFLDYRRAPFVPLFQEPRFCSQLITLVLALLLVLGSAKIERFILRKAQHATQPGPLNHG